MEQEVRKLQRLGTHSYAVVLPKTIIEKYGWKERQKLSIIDKGNGRLELRDWKRH